MSSDEVDRTHGFTDAWSCDVTVAGIAYQVGVVGMPSTRSKSEPFGYVRKHGVTLWQRAVPPSADAQLILALAGVTRKHFDGSGTPQAHPMHRKDDA